MADIDNRRVLNLAANGSAPADVRDRLTRRDKAPSTRDASTKWVEWGDLGKILGQPFDNQAIPLSKLTQMRRDPMIAFALMFCKVPLVRAQWYIKSQDARIAAFIDAELRKIWGRYVLASANDMDYGFSPIVKRFALDRPQTTYIDKSQGEPQELPVWDSDVDAVVWKPFMPVNPQKATPAWTRDGDFNGFYINQPSKGFNTSPNQPPDVPLDYALWSTNEKDSVFGNIYGYPRTGYAFRYWWSYWYRFALSDRAFERFADPAIIVYHPPDDIDERTGEEATYSDDALTIGEDVRSGDTVAMPNSMIMGYDDRGTGLRQWEIKAMEGRPDFDALNTAFEYLDIQKVRAIMVPEQAFLEGRGGTSSRNVAATMGDAFQESMAVKMAEIVDQTNRFVIPQLVELNFGAGAARCEVVSKGFDPQDIDTMRQIVQLVGQTSPDKLGADLPAILDRLGVPKLSVEDINRQIEEARKAAESTLAPPTNEGGGNAGVDQQGLYYDDNEVIHLTQFPRSRHYEDPQIAALGQQLASVWERELREQ